MSKIIFDLLPLPCNHVTISPMDLSLIKKKIETGVIRNDMEFQRDMLLMFQNALMYNSSNHDV